MRLIAYACAALVLGAAAATAQTLSANIPPWARELLTADFDAINGGRSTLVGLDVEAVVRVTVVPREGGVARVIRYEVNDGTAEIALRRFTGHPQQGWWLWGPDTPAYLAVGEDDQAALAQLARSALGVAGRLSAPQDENALCPSGEAAYVEIAQGAATPFTAVRSCLVDDAVSALARRLSDMAGSQDEAALNASAIAELMAQDRAFAAAAEQDGVQAAFQAFAREDALFFYPGREPFEGPAGIDSRFSRWPTGARLLWEPRFARVSSRGDMGWTWGEGLFVMPDGETATSWYVAIWQRDLDGVWKWVVDIGIDGPPEASALLQDRAANPPN
jgi:ketosteroid isomerase-like protein